MILLLNNERVLAELVELAKRHISALLGVNPEAVSVEIELAPGGVVRPQFQYQAPDDAGALEKEYIQQCMAEVWLGWAKAELIDRLRGLKEVRHGFRRQSDNTSQDSSSESNTSPESESKKTAGESRSTEG